MIELIGAPNKAALFRQTTLCRKRRHSEGSKYRVIYYFPSNILALFSGSTRFLFRSSTKGISSFILG